MIKKKKSWKNNRNISKKYRKSVQMKEKKEGKMKQIE